MKKLLLIFTCIAIFYALLNKPAKFTGTIKGIANTNNEAVKIGKQFSNGSCEGSGKKLMTTAPMKPQDIRMILPYGTMVGGHVMPTSHQYLEPWDRTLGRDKYEVRAAMDATLYSISRRAQNVESGKATAEEFQLWFAVSCTHFYYYDLMTSLSPDLRKIFDQKKQQNDSAYVNIQVKAGQVLGKIGGQTLDYGVWDTQLPSPAGILVPKHYGWDGFRPYLADPLNYYTDDLKKIMLSKYVRTTKPISGKVDYDIDGTLVGGWFLKGTGEVTGGQSRKYWAGHLAFAPEYLDPSVYLISVGDFAGQEKQFSISRSAPNPINVSVKTGLVKYDLLPWTHVQADGTPWHWMRYSKGVRIVNEGNQKLGCVLVQMLESRKLKFEGFQGKTCASIKQFTSSAKTYER
ncbi:MAG TPA: hypothetical protein VJI96_04855 [Candidatus Andersenbacteria bacterium]|nr:hypothetical protein [Candidatus Andersenbacteria bacterium]